MSFSPRIPALFCFAVGGMLVHGPAPIVAQSDDDTDVPQNDLAIHFEARAGAEPVACGTEISALGATRSRAEITDFRMFVSDFRLVDAEGAEVPVEMSAEGPWSNGHVTLLDFEDATGPCTNGTPQTNALVAGTVPEGDYRGLRFVVGVPFEFNHADPTMADTPLDLTAMFWNWNAGYKFVRLEMTTAGLPQGYSFHLGSTRCRPGDSRVNPATSCADPNRVQVSLEDFDPTTDRVVVDIASLFSEADIDQPGRTFAGCMSGRSSGGCDPILGALGLFGDAPQRMIRAETLRP